jgi:hypothetical protein
MDKKIINQLQTKLCPTMTQDTYVEWTHDHQKDRDHYLNQYVRVVREPRNIFQKKSMMDKIGLELFKIEKVRPPIGDVTKDPILYLRDMLEEAIIGTFGTDEVILVDPSTPFHPKNKQFLPTISIVDSIRRQGRNTFYTVGLAGKYLTSGWCCCSVGVASIWCDSGGGSTHEKDHNEFDPEMKRFNLSVVIYAY